jgi:hypothetical protein
MLALLQSVCNCRSESHNTGMAVSQEDGNNRSQKEVVYMYVNFVRGN